MFEITPPTRVNDINHTLKTTAERRRLGSTPARHFSEPFSMWPLRDGPLRSFGGPPVSAWLH
jgi:hypothetical protein